MSFIIELNTAFESFRHPKNAKAMQAYMKGLFPFIGIKAEPRKAICQTTIISHLDEVKSQLTDITTQLYSFQEREYHYCAMELFAKYRKGHYHEDDIKFIEHLIITHSHWDTVDFIAKHILGRYLLEYPEKVNKTIKLFSKSSNMWLNRSAILFQLGYKAKTNAALLFKLCKAHNNSNEFFIQKAIGWALREYAKTDPSTVLQFAQSTPLKPLSKREAIRRLI